MCETNMTPTDTWELEQLTSGPKAMILRMHSNVKRAVKRMFRYFSMVSYSSGAP